MLHPYGTIALPCGEQARYSRCAYSLANLVKPDGCTLAMVNGISIPRSLNLIIRDLQGEWIWFQADDHVYDPHLLWRMLDRNVDVLVPLIIRHGPPFAPVVFKSQNEKGQYQPFAYDEIPESGLFEVFAAGTGGMLVRKHVLDAIGDPWFTFGKSGEVPNEDLEFCRKVREAGFKIWADADNLMGHMGMFAVWPERVNGDWGIKFEMGKGPEGAMNEIHVNVEKVREPVVAAA